MAQANMNPFEIRLKILEMAKEYLDTSYDTAKELAKQNLSAMDKQGELNMEMWKQMMPEQYTMEDIITKAQELYGFVESKQGKPNHTNNK